MNHGNVSPAIAKGLLTLKNRIEAAKIKIPSSKIDETLNIATWNIRAFGKKPRTEAAVHYIAEILGQFDLIGIVELADDLTDLGRVLQILGPTWRAVYSDMIPDGGGNRERSALFTTSAPSPSTGLPPRRTNRERRKDSNISPKQPFGAAPTWLRSSPAVSTSSC